MLPEKGALMRDGTTAAERDLKDKAYTEKSIGLSKYLQSGYCNVITQHDIKSPCYRISVPCPGHKSSKKQKNKDTPSSASLP